MENTPQELETNTSSNKDLWLFLIVLDVIFLCVFGFFLYKHFTAQLVNKPAPAAVAETETQTVEALPEELVEVTQAEVVTQPAPQEEVATVVQPVVQPAPAKEEAPAVEQPAPAVETQAPAKESVVVTTVPNSKYRRVTFKWFGEGKKISIVSGFTMSKPQALKKVGDHWETTLSILPGTYKFLYIVDGKNTRDPYSAEKDGRSLVVIK